MILFDMIGNDQPDNQTENPDTKYQTQPRNALKCMVRKLSHGTV